MLCSLPSAKSSSTWLDRLHTLKGFNNPAAPPNPNPDALPQNSNPNSTSVCTSSQMRPFNVLSSILSDLFVMDPPNSARTQTVTLKPGAKKGLRKQHRPRICILSNVRKCRSLAQSVSNGVTELKIKKQNSKLKKNKEVMIKHKNNKKKKKKGSEAGSGLDGSATGSNSGSGVKGRTEATVIDTSTPGWKSTKILIRKGPNWKIRDKKQWNAGLNKRKRFGLASNKEKELTPRVEPSDPLDQGDTHEEPIDQIENPVKRLKCSKPPSVPEAAKSIALHLKVRTNGKKKSLSISKSSLKEKIQP